MSNLVYKKFTKKQKLFLDGLRKPADTSSGFEEACSKSVVVFSEYMLGMKLYYWEVAFLYSLQCVLEKKPISKILDGDGSIKSMVLALTSRQIGKSTCLAVFALWASFFNKKPDKRFKSTQVLIVSRSFDQAKKLLREIKRTYQDGDRFMFSHEKYSDADGNPIFGKDYFSKRLAKNDSNNATSINWRPYDERKDGEFVLAGSNAASGIRCYAPTDVVLGETFTIGFVDEAGHKSIEDDFWFDSLKKTGDANQAMWAFTSTPWQSSGFFYEYCDLEGKNATDYIWKVVATIDTLQHDIDADNDYARVQYEGVLEDIKRDEALGKLDSVRRGYYCEFVQGEDSYFDPEKVKNAFPSDAQMVDYYSGECDLGVDFGAQKSSKTTLTISTLKDERIIRLWHREYSKGTDLQLTNDIEELFTRFNIQRIVPDDCPAGSFMIEEWIQKGWNITPMAFRTWKVKKYGAFRAQMFKGTVESYEDDSLRKQMLAMRNSENTKQSYIQAAKGYNDDLIDGWILSCFHFLHTDDRVKFHEW